MYKFYECNVCGHEKLREIEKCPLCDIGEMISMTVIRSDVLEKLKLELKYYKNLDSTIKDQFHQEIKCL